MIWLNTGVANRLSVEQYIANLGLWTTPRGKTTANSFFFLLYLLLSTDVPRSVVLVLFYELLCIQVSWYYNVVNNLVSDVQLEEIL